MKYFINISRQALKDLEVLPLKVNRKIAATIEELSNDPRPAGCKKLKGEEETLWRIRIGDYRVIYAVDDTVKIIQIRKIGHRKNIYD